MDQSKQDNWQTKEDKTTTGKQRKRIQEKHLGEIMVAHNGQKMTLIAYRKSNDIDVQFEDGTTTYNKTYTSFKKGAIANPNIPFTLNKRAERIGEVRIASNGQRIEIIEYTSSRDITVRFEDGAIVYHQLYSRFSKGNIIHPNTSRAKKERIGEVRTANNGQKMKIIEYKSHSDMNIEFEDGTVVKHRTYTCFLKGTIGNPNISRTYNLKNRVGKEAVANNGMKMKIIAYRKACDIDVQFEDGTIVEHRSYGCFIGGAIAHPNIRKKRLATSTAKKFRLGETNVATNGMKMKIIAYRSAMDIDIEFEDGTVVEHRTYACFRNGAIANPKLHLASPASYHSRVGETKKANCGMKMTITEYRNSSDLDVQFEDETIVRHKTYSNFKNGAIGNPTLRMNEKEEKAKKYIGMSTTAHNGQIMVIIAYRGTNDIDVAFLDGAIARHRTLRNFKKGSIANPKQRSTYEGE